MAAEGQIRVGFIGCGRMATAIASGLVNSGFVKGSDICGSDPSAETRHRFATETGGSVEPGNPAVVTRSDVVVLAVKPQHMPAALSQIAPLIGPQHLVVSVAAGVPLALMVRALGGDVRLVRVMPNTPCLVQAGATAFATGGTATADDARLVERMFATIGIAFEVAEPLLDAVTGLSGSGPAYAFQVIEALSDGGVRCGLPRQIATRLAAQTLLGAAKMVLETGEHPGALKDGVASPGGTTIAGLHELEKGALRGTLMNAVLAATQKSQDLGAQAAGGK